MRLSDVGIGRLAAGMRMWDMGKGWIGVHMIQCPYWIILACTDSILQKSSLRPERSVHTLSWRVNFHKRI